MRLITLNIKGPMSEALAALDAHNIESKFVRAFDPDVIISGSHLVQCLVDGRYGDQVAAWYAQTPQQRPFPNGTLLHYRWHDHDTVPAALRDFATSVDCTACPICTYYIPVSETSDINYFHSVDYAKFPSNTTDAARIVSLV